MVLQIKLENSPPAPATVSLSTRPIRPPLAFPRDLERTIQAVRQLQGRRVESVTIRDDCRQLRISLDGPEILLIAAHIDENGKTRLDADLLRADDDAWSEQ